jgi:hypothetical protein
MQYVLSGRSTTLLRAIASGPQATGETEYQPQPHKEQEEDRSC